VAIPFGRGWVWPLAAGTQTTLTAAYVASTVNIHVAEERYLYCTATLPAGGVADPCLQVRVDLSLDGGTTYDLGWKEISIPAYEVGDHFFEIRAPHNSTIRLACRDILADADTTTAIHCIARTYPIEEPGDQPIELAFARTAGVIAWSDGAGAADALGAGAFAYGPAGGTQWVPVGRADTVKIYATTTGGPPTSIEMQLEESPDDGVTVAVVPLVNWVVAGVANQMPGQVQMQSAAGTLANGTYESREIKVTPGCRIRLSAQRTGAAVNLLARYRLSRTEV